MTTSVGIGRVIFDVDLLQSGRYAVRPQGALGTCGFHPYPWTVIMVRAVNPVDAARKAYPKAEKQWTAAKAAESVQP